MESNVKKQKNEKKEKRKKRKKKKIYTIRVAILFIYSAHSNLRSLLYVYIIFKSVYTWTIWLARDVPAFCISGHS